MVTGLDGFRKALKAKGKKEHVIDDLCARVQAFESALAVAWIPLSEAGLEDVRAWGSSTAGPGAAGPSKNDLRALALYYSWAGRTEFAKELSQLREAAIAKTRKTFAMRAFRGVDQDHMDRLEREGIVDVRQMIAAGATPALRRALADRTGIPPAAIEEYVKLADISRIGAVREVRARLYVDAGLDTVDKVAALDAEEFRRIVLDHVERTGFDGVATLPKEAANAVVTARAIPRLVKWE